jgi:hypothetical protein
MIISLCAECGIEIGRKDDGQEGTCISHGLCRWHFLETAVQAEIATPEEIQEYVGGIHAVAG